MSRFAGPASRRPGPVDPDRDRGTALIMVLVLMIITSLFVLPLAQYSMSVLRANSVLTNKTKRIEAVKAGLRVSLADPVHLYEACGAAGPSVPVVLAPTTANDMGVTTKCYFIDHQTAQASDQLRFGLTATRAGATPPVELRGKSHPQPAPGATRAWWADTTKQSSTDKIWLPDLPSHGLNRRSSTGTAMPSGFPTCKVYFPGTYLDPLVLDGPTYFTSGIYYFQNEVRIVGGADVVVGLGATEGCTNDQEAIFYAVNPPGTHNMNGLGATWVFGGRGRLITTNGNGSPISLTFNARYVAEGDVGAAPSADVSIMSVNGQLAADGVTGTDLVAPGIIEVPVSMVAGTTPRVATAEDYLPSVFTPKPVVPDAPATPTAQRFVGAAVVSWTAPFNGGSPLTGYVVTASSGATCTTSGATSCAFVGLPSSPVTFTVVARNAIGNSVSSSISAAVTPGGSATLVSPSQPARPTAVPYRRAARVSWTAPGNGGAPITAYTVTAAPGGATCNLDVSTATVPPLQCDIAGLDPLTAYTFTVVATNAVGPSTTSPASSVAVLPALGLGDPPAIPAPVTSPFDPTAIVEFDLPTTANVTVTIPGYVAVPQGRFLVNNPRGLAVTVAGGVLAAQFSVADARATGPQTVDIGFLESVVQRKFRIVSTATGGRETSTAVVQVNQNGAYAINSWEVQ
jgi:hypothetical protein